MKKHTFLFLIVTMLFAFVSCSPEASSGATDSTLLLGEVTPPSEGERVAASDEDLKQVQSILGARYSKTESSAKTSFELDFGNDGKITITIEGTSSKSKATANGQVKIDGVVYKADNFVLKLAMTSDGKKVTTIESGSFLKDGTAMTATEAMDFLSNCIDGDVSENSKCIGEKIKGYQTSKVEIKGTDGTIIGTGTLTEEDTLTKDSYLFVYVFDYIVDGVRVQAKMRESSTASDRYDFDYIALNGKFFNEESLTKFAGIFHMH